MYKLQYPWSQLVQSCWDDPYPDPRQMTQEELEELEEQVNMWLWFRLDA